jgi:hypothetical protein
VSGEADAASFVAVAVLVVSAAVGEEVVAGWLDAQPIKSRARSRLGRVRTYFMNGKEAMLEGRRKERLGTEPL